MTIKLLNDTPSGLKPGLEIEKKIEFSKELKERLLKTTAGIEIKGMDMERYASLPIEYRKFEEAKSAFITQDPKMLEMKTDAIMLAESDCNVLIRGETGTGKELVAKILHGKRDPSTFVTVNCTAIPGELFESILFGHKRGSFTSAYHDQPGLIERAHGGGTVFLDEIGDLPPAQQGKMLRTIEYGEYYPVGMDEKRTIRCRWICATNKDIKRMSVGPEPTFRNDLYWRIAEVVLRTSPIHERTGDIRLIVNDICAKNKWDIMSDSELAGITYRDGNVREMRAYLKHMQVLGKPPEIEL